MPVEIVVPIAFFAMVASIVLGLPLVRARVRAAERNQLTPPYNPDVIARLDRIEQAIELMATEVERITEGQRFVTKLLADSRPAALPATVASANAASVNAASGPPSNPDDGTILSPAARRP